MNYFQLFELPYKYQLNKDELTRKYLELQSKFHPDKAKNLDEKNEFTVISSDINVGYKLLKDDLLRAEYFLKLENLNIDDFKLDNIYLNQIWEERELINDSIDQVYLESLLEEKIIYRKTLLLYLNLTLNNSDLQNGLAAFVKLKYADQIINSLKEKISSAINRD